MRSHEPSCPVAAHRRFVRVVSALCIGAAGLGVVGVTGLTLAATPAGASTATGSGSTTLAGTQNLSATGVSASGGGVTATFDLTQVLHWSQPAQITTTFHRNQIRQGRTPAVRDSYSTAGAGTMSVSSTLNNLKVSFGSTGPIDLGSPSFVASAPCNLATSGTPFACSLKSPKTGLISTPFGYTGPYVNLSLETEVTVTPQELATMRTLAASGAPGVPVSLRLDETPVTDTFNLPCSDGAGDVIGYDLGTPSATDGVSVVNSLLFDTGAASPNSESHVEGFSPTASPTIQLSPLAGSIALSGSGLDFDLGHLRANDVPPIVSAGGPYSGVEGSPVAFDGSGSSDVCGVPTLEWRFSDGGVADGAHPEHTFGSPGTFGVLVRASDATGLTSSRTFEVSVVDNAPVVDAGPSQTTEWGLPVTFNGTATDPNAALQPMLSDRWAFGAGGSAAGAGATHIFATPGVYSATFQSCDPQLHCHAGGTRVTVTVRGTTTAYTGAVTSGVGDAVTYAASVLDDLGDPVPDGIVDFYADGSSTPFASTATNSMGFAFASGVFPRGRVGSHTVTASYAGSALYTGSSYGPVGYAVTDDASPVSHAGPASRTVTTRGTTTAYTGVTTSRVSQSVTYAASVLDDQGDPVSGGIVDFYADGSSTPFTSAVTNSYGFAFATGVFPRDTVGGHTVTASYAGSSRDTGSSYGPVGYAVTDDAVRGGSHRNAVESERHHAGHDDGLHGSHHEPCEPVRDVRRQRPRRPG